MRKVLFVLCAALLFGGVALLATADGPAKIIRAKKASGAKASKARRTTAGTRDNSMARLEREVKLEQAPSAFGTITYDVENLTAVPTVADRTFGNQYDTALTVGGGALGPVQVNGTITRLSWGLWGNSTGTGTWGSFWITFFGPVSGTQAQVLRSYALGGVGGPGPQFINYTFSPPVAYTGSSFLVGMYNDNSAGAPPWNGVFPLFDGGTINGQGYHGMGINWNTTTGTGFATISSLNAIMRPTGNLLTPVELMSFSVE